MVFFVFDKLDFSSKKKKISHVDVKIILKSFCFFLVYVLSVLPCPDIRILLTIFCFFLELVSDMTHVITVTINIIINHYHNYNNQQQY